MKQKKGDAFPQALKANKKLMQYRLQIVSHFNSLFTIVDFSVAKKILPVM